jgi:hypothetical protein
MTSPENLGRQFVNVYRGMAAHPDEVNYGRLGIHWTTDPSIAHEFAITRKNEGTILEAKVPVEHVVQKGTDEWNRYDEVAAMSGGGDTESEITLRRGAPVTVQKITHVKREPKTIGGLPTGQVGMPTRTAKPVPKEGKA